jgi:hypothetical protein
MDVCERYQIPYSTFLRWDVDDRHKAVMHRMRKAGACQRCGTHPDEWDPTKGGFVDAYVADTDECKGCAAVERAQAELDKRPQPGVTVRLRKFDPDTDDTLGGGPRG